VVNGTKIDPEIVAAFKCPPPPTPQAVAALYARGIAVGRAWHGWYSTLTGDVRAGATYWMMRDYNANACAAPDPSTMRLAGVDARNALPGNRDFSEGCLKAKSILGVNPPTDNMDYLRGWNTAMAEPPLPAAQLAKPLPSYPSASAAPNPPARTPNNPAPGTSSSSGNYASLLDGTVAQDSQSWLLNHYRQGSIRNVHVVSENGSNSTIRGDYTYTDGKEGWVEMQLSNGKASCVRYWDFPSECRAIGQGLARQMEEENARKQAAWDRLPPAEKERRLAEGRRCQSRCSNEGSQCNSNNSSNAPFAAFGPSIIAGMAAGSMHDCQSVYDNCMSSCR
jgi:hypothetical protein